MTTLDAGAIFPPQPNYCVEYDLPCPCDCDCDSLGDCLDLDAVRWPDPAHPEAS